MQSICACVGGQNLLDVKMYSPQTLNKFVLEEVSSKGLESF